LDKKRSFYDSREREREEKARREAIVVAIVVMHLVTILNSVPELYLNYNTLKTPQFRR
jgi:hypothetical protein